MAGHSKWANIQHRRPSRQAGKLWTKIIREITVACAGGPDPDSNPRLRMAWDKATDANMPATTSSAPSSAAPAAPTAKPTRKSATRATASAARR